MYDRWERSGRCLIDVTFLFTFVAGRQETGSLLACRRQCRGEFRMACGAIVCNSHSWGDATDPNGISSCVGLFTGPMSEAGTDFCCNVSLSFHFDRRLCCCCCCCCWECCVALFHSFCNHADDLCFAGSTGQFNCSCLPSSNCTSITAVSRALFHCAGRISMEPSHARSCFRKPSLRCR